MSGRDEAVVRVLPLNDAWNVYGSDERRGVTVEGLKVGADDWGTHDIAFTLNRDPGVTFADLQAAAPLEVEFGGSLLASGRISETPTSEVNRQIAVQGQGWQFHLDDDDYQKTFVQTSLSSWVDARQWPTSTLSRFKAAGSVGTSAQGSDGTSAGSLPTLSWPAGAAVGGASNDLVGVILDMGPSNLAKRVVLGWESFGPGAPVGSHVCSVWAGDTVAGIITDNPISFNLNAGASGTNAGTLTTPRRFLCLLLQWIGAAGTFSDSNFAGVRATSIQVFTATAYESGNASILKASDVIKDALPHAPLLNQSTGLITATSFNIPDLTATSYQTARDYTNAANAYHAFQVRVNPDKTLEYRARPTSPLLTNVFGTFDDQSAGSLDQVFNKCVGNATGPDGVGIVSIQVASPATTIPDRRGYFKTNALNTNMSLTQTALDQLCATFVSAHRSMPFKGTLTVTGWDSVRMTVGGASVPAWELLRYVGELIHFPNLVDPDTGAKGRDGRISAVSYDHDSMTASVSIDSQRSNFEALLARLQVVTGRVS